MASDSVVADCTQLYTLWLTLQHKRPSLEPVLGLSILGYRGNMADSTGENAVSENKPRFGRFIQ